MVNGALITCFYVFIIILDNLPCIINLNMVNALVLLGEHYKSQLFIRPFWIN